MWRLTERYPFCSFPVGLAPKMLHTHSPELGKSCCLIITASHHPFSPFLRLHALLREAKARGHRPHHVLPFFLWEAQLESSVEQRIKRIIDNSRKTFLNGNPTLHMSSLEPEPKKAFASNALNLDAQGSQVAQPLTIFLNFSSL